MLGDRLSLIATAYRQSLEQGSSPFQSGERHRYGLGIDGRIHGLRDLMSRAHR